MYNIIILECIFPRSEFLTMKILYVILISILFFFFVKKGNWDFGNGKIK